MVNYLLCDDPLIRQQLLPLTFTRPIALLRMGITTIREKWNYFLGEDQGFLVPEYLQAKFPARSQARCLFVNASVIPDKALADTLRQLAPDTALVKDNEWIAFWGTSSDIPAFNPENCLSDRKRQSYTGDFLQIRHPWDIFSMNGRQIEKDFLLLTADKESARIQGFGIETFGEYPIYAEEGVEVVHALIDTTEGPVYLGKNSRIMPGAIVKGPLALCEGSMIKIGAKIYGGNTFGPYCKVAGEVESSVLTGYSNKAHDGFLGDAVLGEWCNLGAGTNCSNLKNDYSPVKVWSYAREGFVQTGLQFCGLFMGDHSKSAIGTQFNTGTVVGVGVNVFGAGFPKNYIPSFMWGKEIYRVEKAIETAKVVYARRNRVFTETDADILRSIYAQTVGNREHSQQDMQRA